MLSLRFSKDDYAFVYTRGQPIGAILVGEIKGRGQFSLLFCGREVDFEILRPRAVERRFGPEELEKLRSRFLRPSSIRAPRKEEARTEPASARAVRTPRLQRAR